MTVMLPAYHLEDGEQFVLNGQTWTRYNPKNASTDESRSRFIRAMDERGIKTIKVDRDTPVDILRS